VAGGAKQTLGAAASAWLVGGAVVPFPPGKAGGLFRWELTGSGWVGLDRVAVDVSSVAIATAARKTARARPGKGGSGCPRTVPAPRAV
jgi:hypothetical protein